MLPDTIVTTKDGRRHRVIYEAKGKLFVKCAEGKSKPAYKICVTAVVSSETQKKDR